MDAALFCPALGPGQVCLEFLVLFIYSFQSSTAVSSFGC